VLRLVVLELGVKAELTVFYERLSDRFHWRFYLSAPRTEPEEQI
jgi:hypothetical protein